MTALQDTKYFPFPNADCHELPSPESLTDSPNTTGRPAADASGYFSAQAPADICLQSAFVVLRMFRYLTEVLMDRHMDLLGLRDTDEEETEAIRASLPFTIPLMACSAMQACYVMVMTLYKIKSKLVSEPPGDESTAQRDLNFQHTERLAEELRHGVQESLQMLEKYQEEFLHINAMYQELKMVYKVAFADV